jgi:hypothetical protein
VEEFTVKIEEYQRKVRDIQKEFDLQTVQFSKKVIEKRDECERLKAVNEKT